MDAKELIQHFGTVSNAATALEVSVQAIYNWEREGAIPPLRQSDIEVRTSYKLKSEFTSNRLRKKRGDNGSG